ncbi:MAG: ferrous iron transport protein A [Burkholderiaceae bacterium]|nr:ferrous iron transport protein A [Burkholderiaceae bacterium]MCD8537061.1 ferrous iron transport protein A [Burkholderiaceae bacterium]MCD8564473.1 ferrous iron transport protein A [Burkholderiaceae bacterium]
MTTLGELKIGDCAKVTGFSQTGSSYRRKLLAMGLTPLTTLEVIRMAPMGDPVEVRVRGCSISLRRAEANMVNVEVL